MLKEHSTFFENRLIFQLPKSYYTPVEFYRFRIHSADLRVWR